MMQVYALPLMENVFVFWENLRNKIFSSDINVTKT